MKKLYCAFVLVACILVPVMVFATATVPKLFGTWGYAKLVHYGQWNSETGTLVFNSSGTGSDTYQYNDNGNLNTGTISFNYSAVTNSDGSITLTLSGGASGTKRIMLSDDGKMFLQDGTNNLSQQTMMIAVKVDPSRTNTNADMNGSYCSISYEHDSSGGYFNGAHYIGYSHIDTFDGNGGMHSDLSYNADGSMGSFLGIPNNYWFAADKTIQTSSNYTGYGTGDMVLGVGAAPTTANTWQIHGTMKKGDKTYGTSDLAGTWASVAFGDYAGTSFHSAIGLWNCNSDGHCAVSYKFQQDGSLAYRNDSATLAISPDGSFGGSLAASAPSYAAAIGNNGNNMMMNWGLDTDNPNYRHVKVAVRCNSCVNITGQMIPMIAINTNFAGMNLYIYDPSSSTINTVKENGNMSWMPSINSTQGFAAYAEGPQSDNPYSIYVYNTSSPSVSQIAGKYTRWESAYFDGNDKILFIDDSTGTISRMDSNGSNVVPLTSPDTGNGYIFRVFWLSPDRNTMAAVEERTPGDYNSTNHDRLVFIDADTGARISTLSEYFGEWNMGIWKADSSRFLYYYHAFDGSGGSTPKYAVYSNLSSASPAVTDLSGSDLGGQPDNICFFTKSGNLLSLSSQKLYNGQTGALIADRSSDVPFIFNTMFGIDGNGEIYFAGRDKSNVRRFVEFPSACGISNPIQVGTSTYSLISDAYNSASGSNPIQLQAFNFNENVSLQRNIAVHLQGGCDCSYNPNAASFSTIHGDLMISSGTVTVDNVVIQ